MFAFIIQAFVEFNSSTTSRDPLFMQIPENPQKYPNSLGKSAANYEMRKIIKMNPFRAIECEIMVPASIQRVWNAWTSSKEAVKFFAPAAHIDARPGGAYEILFNPSARVGEQGSEGMRILSIQKPHFLSFTWNAPPHLADIRGSMTFVEIRLSQVPVADTRVNLRHGGWGQDGQWEDAYAYFSKAWGTIVLPRLKYSFDTAPVDWSNPPCLSPQF